MKFKSFSASVMSMILALSSMGSASFAAEKKQNSVVQYAGNTRVETSIITASEVKSDYLVVASGYNFADSLSAFNIASSKNAKLVLLGKSASPLKNVLSKSTIKYVYAVGGKDTLTGEVEDVVSSSIGASVRRLAGDDRYKTNELTLIESGYDSVGVADGRNFPDALSASGLLKAKGLGLMLVNGSKPYTTNRKVMYTFGGVNSVRQDGGKRISGSDRYSTSMLVSNEIGNVDTVAVAYGKTFPDALSAVNVLQMGEKASVLLIGDSIRKDSLDMLWNTKKVKLIGGNINYTNIQRISKDVNPKSVDGKDILDKNDLEEKVDEESKDKNALPSEFTVDTPLSDQEKELADRINNYRKSLGKRPFNISKSLTYVARTHVRDSNKNHPENQVDSRGVKANLHSWSNSGRWQGVAYTPDHYHASLMWSKPSELTSYTGRGYEISYGAQWAKAEPLGALEGWKHSPGHHAVIRGDGNWSTLAVMGVGIEGGYAHVWFGEEEDPAGYHITYSDAMTPVQDTSNLNTGGGRIPVGYVEFEKALAGDFYANGSSDTIKFSDDVLDYQVTNINKTSGDISFDIQLTAKKDFKKSDTNGYNLRIGGTKNGIMHTSSYFYKYRDLIPSEMKKGEVFKINYSQPLDGMQPRKSVGYYFIEFCEGESPEKGQLTARVFLKF